MENRRKQSAHFFLEPSIYPYPRIKLFGTSSYADDLDRDNGIRNTGK